MKIVYTIIALLTCSASFAQSGRYILDLGIPQSYEPTKAVVKDYGTHQLAGGMYHNGQNALYFWLAKLNSDTVVWSKSISASPYWYPMDINPTEIVECNNGDIIFIGRGIAFAGQYSAKVIKTDASGNLLWQKEFFAQNQYSQGVYENNPAILENDGIILSMSGDNDLYEAKIDFSGNLVSSHQLKLDVTSSGITPGYLFIPNHSGGYFAGFECDSSVAVVSLDASMNVLWAKKMLIGENARLRSIYQTTAGSILIGGLTGMQGETFIGELNPNGTVQSYHQLSNSELYSIDQLFEINDSTLLANTRTGYLKINKNDVLDKTQSRIETIATIHESLYKYKDLALINVANYWEKLVNDCLNSLVNEPANFKLNLDIDYLELPVDKMIPLGLLINELVTNSILHGFKGRNTGTIYLSLRLKDGKYHLTYKDDGVGIHQPKKDDNEHHFGHFLIEGFAEQLNGSIKQVDSKSGVHFELEFE